jgi:hypothetical protein
VNATDVNGSTPLHDAAAGGYLEICQVSHMLYLYKEDAYHVRRRIHIM